MYVGTEGLPPAPSSTLLKRHKIQIVDILLFPDIHAKSKNVSFL